MLGWIQAAMQQNTIDGLGKNLIRLHTSFEILSEKAFSIFMSVLFLRDIDSYIHGIFKLRH